MPHFSSHDLLQPISTSHDVLAPSQSTTMSYDSQMSPQHQGQQQYERSILGVSHVGDMGNGFSGSIQPQLNIDGIMGTGSSFLQDASMSTFDRTKIERRLQLLEQQVEILRRLSANDGVQISESSLSQTAKDNSLCLKNNRITKVKRAGPKRRRETIGKERKLEIIKYRVDHNNVSITELSKHFNLARTTVIGILNNRSKYLQKSMTE
ncbi:hypothetical protein BGZ76_004686 [Entomortierella beljakovae]|nr:hypothetical protein BGZ76_004686 [Entomortierella beljakovae]